MTVLGISSPVPDAGLTVGVVAGHDGLGPGPLWVCNLFHQLSETTRPVLSLIDLDMAGNPLTGKISEELSFSIEVGRTSTFRIELRELMSPSKVAQTCKLDFETAGAITVEDEDNGPVDGVPGLRTRGVRAGFDYFVVYGRKP